MELAQTHTHTHIKEPNNPVINSHLYGRLICGRGTKVYNEVI